MVNLDNGAPPWGGQGAPGRGSKCLASHTTCALSIWDLARGRFVTSGSGCDLRPLQLPLLPEDHT